jgi:hypothetical protein
MTSLCAFRKPRSSRAIGIEIECYVSSNPRGSYLGFFYAGNDESIQNPYGTYAVEFVSQPLTVPWLNKEIVRLWKKHQWEANSTCGIHLHVSRKWCAQEKALLIYKFVEDLWINHRLMYLNTFGRAPNHYCNMEPPDKNGSRYVVINTTNKDTVEFRLFTSGDARWAQKCVLTVDWLLTNAKHLNVDALEAFLDMRAEVTNG